MIKLLTPSEAEKVEKESVIDLEQQILNVLSFDFNYPAPLPFLERYLRIGDLQNDLHISSLAEELLLVAIKRILFLNFRPSLIASASLVIAYSL